MVRPEIKRLAVQKMPERTQRAHYEPSWRGDGFAGLRDVAKKSPGPDRIRAIDCNFQWAWTNRLLHRAGGTAYCMHWGVPGKDNYPYILRRSGRIERMTKRELRRPISQWKAADVARWRRKTSSGWTKPPTYAEMVHYAANLGVYITAELKSSAFASALPAAQVVNAAKAAGHPPWFMALYKSMPNCRGKCAQIIKQGGYFAVIFGTYQHYRDDYYREVRTWTTRPTEVW